LGPVLKRCRVNGCKAELTDPTKGYCSQHIYNMAWLNDTVEWLKWRYEIERLAKQDEADVEHKADL